MSHELTAYLFDFDHFLTQENGHTVLSKQRKPDKFESHSSLNLSFTSIQDLR